MIVTYTGFDLPKASQPGYPDAPLPYEEIKAGAGSQVARYLNHEGPPPREEPPPEEKEDARQAGEVGAAAPPTDVDTTGSSPEHDPQAATTALDDWRQNPYVQLEGGFLAGVSLGLVPMGGVGQQLADAGELLPHGTPEARLGLAVGQIVGGIALTVGGFTGEVLGGAATVTGIGVAVGVPAMVVSTTLVVGGAGNIAAGIRGLMTTGSGSTGPQGTTHTATGGDKTRWVTPREKADLDHASVRDRLRQAQRGYESGRHDQYPGAMRDELRRMADAADKRGDLPEYSQRLREIAETYDKRAGAAHRGGR
ncbi:MAG TPA: hypothetical protein VE093_20745 [Polyangiaceae bacterium]|nr:hypothetical protein [Polyangiaceae bacterium]